MGKRGKVEKVDTPNGGSCKIRQVKEMGEFMTKEELSRLIQYLKAQGWTDSEIVRLIEFLTQ